MKIYADTYISAMYIGRVNGNNKGTNKMKKTTRYWIKKYDEAKAANLNLQIPNGKWLNLDCYTLIQFFAELKKCY